MSKVLVAEDDRHVRELLVDALFDAGYDVIEAKDGEAALEKATQEHPDLVLLEPVLKVPEICRVEV
jgi:DNA-binding response OmpR family regulator